MELFAKYLLNYAQLYQVLDMRDTGSCKLRPKILYGIAFYVNDSISPVTFQGERYLRVDMAGLYRKRLQDSPGYTPIEIYCVLPAKIDKS